jgi:hypothetical protein
MHTFRFIRSWLEGCRHLLTYDNFPGYRRLAWIERKRIDIAAATSLVCSKLFWRGAFWAAAATLLMHLLTWRYDLVGARRDMLRAIPLLVCLPLVAHARQKCVRMLLRFRDMPHRQSGDDVNN